MPVDAIRQAPVAEIVQHHLGGLSADVEVGGRAEEGGVGGEDQAVLDPGFVQGQQLIRLAGSLRAPVDGVRKDRQRCLGERSGARAAATSGPS